MGHPGDQLAPRLLQPLLADAGLLQPPGGHGQLVADLLELRGTSRPGLESAALAEAAGVLAHGPRPPRERRADDERDAHRDDAGHRDDPEHDLEVVVGEEHRPRRADHAADHGQHRGERDDADLPAEGPVPHDPREGQPEQTGRPGPGGADPDDRPLVVRHRASHR